MIGIIIFLLVCIHMAAGMLSSLIFISQKTLGERFFRFIATTSLILLVLAETVYRLYRTREVTGASRPQVLLWRAHIDGATEWLIGASVVALIYILSLPFRKYPLSLGILAVGVACAWRALAVIAFGLSSRAIPPSLAAFVFSADSLLSAMALGSAVTCMILGHWYLVDPGMSVRPLRTMAGIFIFTVVARVLLSSYTGVMIWRDLSSSGVELLSNVSLVNLFFFGQRVLFGLVLPLALSWMIWQTVKIRSTQSATGILYVAVVFILFGEFLSRYILVATGYPL